MTENYGHATMADGSHVPLTKEDAEAIWAAVETARAKREAQMPTAKDALSALIDAETRLRELGWMRGGGLKVKRGEDCAVAEQGSTGMWKGWLDNDGKYVHFGDCVSDPLKTFLKPLADLTPEEAEWMRKCDASEVAAFSAMLDRHAQIEGDQP